MCKGYDHREQRAKALINKPSIIGDNLRLSQLEVSKNLRHQQWLELYFSIFLSNF